MNIKNYVTKVQEKKDLLRKVLLSTLLEFGPVVIFPFSSNWLRIYDATVLLMIATIISTITTYHTQKRIPYLALYVAIITILFGMLTIHYHQVKFIQMRDTLYDITCALTLLIGTMLNIPFLKIAFGKVLPLSLASWHKLTHLWIGFFIFLAVVNEVVRRNFSLHDWLEFKGWVVFITTIFGFIALYICYEDEPRKEILADNKKLAK